MIRAMGGRLLVIETISLPSLENTRRFYVNRGYSECGRVPHFYAMGDDKVIFGKQPAKESRWPPNAPVEHSGQKSRKIVHHATS